MSNRFPIFTGSVRTDLTTLDDADTTETNIFASGPKGSRINSIVLSTDDAVAASLTVDLFLTKNDTDYYPVGTFELTSPGTELVVNLPIQDTDGAFTLEAGTSLAVLTALDTGKFLYATVSSGDY